MSGIPDHPSRKFMDRPPDGVQVQDFRLCTRCGLRIFMGPHGDSAIEAHLCGKDQLVPILEWSSPASDVRGYPVPTLRPGVVSRPRSLHAAKALSAYGAATILLEETKRAVDVPLQASTRRLCFSDSLQQAARIARRLGRTNERLRRFDNSSFKRCDNLFGPGSYSRENWSTRF